MRSILLTSILWVNILQIFAQDCNTLNNFNDFHGIKFGLQVSENIKKHLKLQKNYDSNDSSIHYSLNHKELAKDFNKLYELFQFGDNNFGHFDVWCLPDGRVFEIDLSRYYYEKKANEDIQDSIEIVNNRLPKTFTSAIDELTSLFGEMTKTKDENNILGGYNLNRIWECEKNRVALSLSYDDFNKFSLGIEISFIDKELEKVYKINNYKKQILSGQNANRH